MISEATKVCAGKHGCGRVLPVSSFRFVQNRLYTYCKACEAKLKREIRKKNPDKRRSYHAQWRRNNWLVEKVRHLVGGAKKRGPSDIDASWVTERLERGVCELTGVPFVYEHRHPAMPSIDRIDPTRPGHMRDNCRLILWGLNSFKGTANESVFLECLEKVSAAFLKG